MSMCHFVLVLFSPFSIAITSLGEERANLSAFRTFVRFVLVWICRFPLPLGVWERLRFVIVALPGLFSYLFILFYEAIYFALCYFVLVFFSLFSIGITSLGERELILVLFVRLLECACLVLSVSSSFCCLGRAAACVAVKSLPVHHHSAGYILFPLGSLSSSWLFWKSNTA